MAHKGMGNITQICSTAFLFERKMANMTLQSERPLDSTDWKIIGYLQQDARLSYEDFPEVLEMHKLSGSQCAMLKVALASMQHLEALNHRLSAHGALVVHLVASSVLPHRVIDWERFDTDFDLPSYPGWSLATRATDP
jgi:DNA-binding Lrp family transcriptional regulator